MDGTCRTRMHHLKTFWKTKDVPIVITSTQKITWNFLFWTISIKTNQTRRYIGQNLIRSQDGAPVHLQPRSGVGLEAQIRQHQSVVAISGEVRQHQAPGSVCSPALRSKWASSHLQAFSSLKRPKLKRIWSWVVGFYVLLIGVGELAMSSSAFVCRRLCFVLFVWWFPWRCW